MRDVNGVSDTQVVADDLVIEAVQIELTADHLRSMDLAVEWHLQQERKY